MTNANTLYVASCDSDCSRLLCVYKKIKRGAKLDN